MTDRKMCGECKQPDPVHKLDCSRRWSHARSTPSRSGVPKLVEDIFDFVSDIVEDLL